MSELFARCDDCKEETLVDFGNLERKPLTKIVTGKGYTCVCGKFQVIFYTTPSMEEAFKSLLRYPPGHKKFLWLFSKALRKAQGIQHGAKRNNDLAVN